MISHKRGDSFEAYCVRKDEAGDPLDITATVIRSQIRGKGFVAELVVTKTDAGAGAFALTAAAASTAGWRPGVADWDIEYTDDGQVISTRTVQLRIVEDVTRDD
jgi:hypothetical protein